MIGVARTGRNRFIRLMLNLERLGWVLIPTEVARDSGMISRTIPI